MSWDTSLLHGSPKFDTSADRIDQSSQPPPVATSLSKHDYTTNSLKAQASLTAGKLKHVLTHNEAMKEVQQLLDAASSPQKRLMNPLGVARQEESGRVVRPDFIFAPLRDQGIISESTKVAMYDNESDSDDDLASESVTQAQGNGSPLTPSMETAHDMQMNKYFGADARIDYYNAYRELHSKTHMFVQITSPVINSRPALRSSASCPTTLDCEIVQPSSTPSSPLRSPTKSRRQSRHRNVPPLSPPTKADSDLNSTHDILLGSSSPRIQFLASCIAKSRPALALVLRKTNCRAFDFSHQGLGDGFIVDFSACLPEIPLVEAINVSENSLSDRAIDALLHALENKPNLFYLNISGNSVGYKSASSLRSYISSSLCTLKTLVLDNADVDDKECALFMISFERNKSVESLSMRTNTIGQPPLQQARGRKANTSPLVKSGNHEQHDQAEGHSELPTGGEAIGAMLNVNLNIQQLDLSWNAVRVDSATPIAVALQLNYHLRELTISHNTLGDGGALALGQALRVNSTLQKLRLEYNAIGSKGALGLSSGLAANIGLHELVLDGNPIGLDGGKALMRASCTRPSSAGANSIFCRLSLLECNLTKAPEPKRQRRRQRKGKFVPSIPTNNHEQLVVFNPSAPVGSYVLNLGEPYENVVAHELFRLGEDINGSSEYRFSRIEFTPISSGKTTAVKLEHVKVHKKAPAIAEVSEPQVPPCTTDQEPTDLVHRQRHRTKSAIDLLFQRVDSDGSGCVDQRELLQAMNAHGIAVAGSDLSRLLQEYDYDGSGSLQAHEFSDLFFRCGFAMIDTDHSGSLDRREVSHVLTLMGINNVSDAEIARMLARYDLDNSGEIDEQEFLAFLKAEILGDSGGDEECNRLSQSSMKPEMVEQWIIRDVSNRAEFALGNSGTLSVELVHNPQATEDSSGVISSTSQTRLGRRISDAFVSKLMANVQGISKNVTEQREFLHLVLEESELLFSFQQALSLLNKQAGTFKTQRRRLEGLSRLLPQMASRHDAASLVAQLVESKDQWMERFALRSRLGRLFNVLLGSLTNSYTFALDNDDDRAALKRLAQLAQEEKLFSKNRSGRGDTSQHGDWENFRNGTINGKSVLLTSTFILNSLLGPSSSLPPSLLANSTAPNSRSSVIVSFHFVSTLRPPRGTQPLSRRRFDQLKRVLKEQLPAADEIHAFSYKIWSGEDDLTADEEEARQRARLNWDLVRQSVLKRSTEKEDVSMAQHVRQSLEIIQNRLALLEMLVADRWLSCQQALELVADFPNNLRARAKAACVLFSRVIDLHNFIQVRQADYIPIYNVV